MIELIANPNFLLEPYQHKGIIGYTTEDKSIYNCLREGKKHLLVCAPGGSGKTVMLAKVNYDFIRNTNYDVVTFVHRKELLNHAREEMMNCFGLYSQQIISETKKIQEGIRSFVCMIETFFERMDDPAFIKYFQNVGLLNIDEAHLNHFKKIFPFFKSKNNCISLGWTATPISADIKDPLNNHYDDIIIIAKNSQLVEINKNKPSRGIVSCTGFDFAIDNINRKELSVKKNGQFDDNDMGSKFSRPQQIKNTLLFYEKHCIGKKTLIFNANRNHSIKMNDAFSYYYPGKSQHIDSDTKSKYGSKKHRTFIFGTGKHDGWFDEENDNILNNVGIATIGTDIKSIEAGIINKSTNSYALFWQMVLRFDRAYIFKDGRIKTHFVLGDLGDNLIGGGFAQTVNWFEEDVDWEYIFNNPKKYKPGVGAVKSCPDCGALNTAAARICCAKIDDWITNEEIECGYMFPFNQGKAIEDLVEKDMIRVEDIIKSKVNVKDNIKFFKERGNKDYFVFIELIKQVCFVFKEENKFFKNYLEIEEFNFIVNSAIVKCNEWFKEANVKKYFQYKKKIRFECKDYLTKLGYIIVEQELEQLSQGEFEFEPEEDEEKEEIDNFSNKWF